MILSAILTLCKKKFLINQLQVFQANKWVNVSWNKQLLVAIDVFKSNWCTNKQVEPTKPTVHEIQTNL